MKNHFRTLQAGFVQMLACTVASGFMTLNTGYNPDGSQYIQYYGTLELTPAGATMGSYWEIDPDWDPLSDIPIAAAIINYSAWGASVTAQDAARLADPITVDYQYVRAQGMSLNFTDVSGPQYGAYTHTCMGDIFVTIGTETRYLGEMVYTPMQIWDDAIWDALLTGQSVQFEVTPVMYAGRYYVYGTYGDFEATSLELYYYAEIPAVPEPSTISLFIGLAILVVVGWHRRLNR